MNTHTASDNRPKPSAGSTASDVDKQLAFIDNVCSLLIESRFGRKSYSPFSEFKPAAEGERSSEWMSLPEFMRPSLTDGDIDPIVDRSFTPPETARPAALANRRSSPAARHSNKGVQAVFARTDAISGTHFAAFLTASIQPRGSPFLTHAPFSLFTINCSLFTFTDWIFDNFGTHINLPHPVQRRACPPGLRIGNLRRVI